MNILDAIYQTVQNAVGGVDALAVRMGLRAQILRNKANPNCATNYLNPVELDLTMALTGNHDILHALAKNHGYVCVKVGDDIIASDLALLEIVTHVWTENGAVGASVHDALADGRIEQSEVAHVKEQVYRATRVLHELVARMEGMAQK